MLKSFICSATDTQWTSQPDICQQSSIGALIQIMTSIKKLIIGMEERRIFLWSVDIATLFLPLHCFSSLPSLQSTFPSHHFSTGIQVLLLLMHGLVFSGQDVPVWYRINVFFRNGCVVRYYKDWYNEYKNSKLNWLDISLN